MGVETGFVGVTSPGPVLVELSALAKVCLEKGPYFLSLFIFWISECQSSSSFVENQSIMGNSRTCEDEKRVSVFRHFTSKINKSFARAQSSTDHRSHDVKPQSRS